MTISNRSRFHHFVPTFATLVLASPLAAQEVPPQASYGSTAPASTNLGWVMAANLVIWGGIALYVSLIHRKAARLETGN